MNVVYLSAHFPEHQQYFCQALRRMGVRVLGITDQPDSHLSPVLKESLDAHLQVPSLHDYASVSACVRRFQSHFGPIGQVESHLETWLPLEARLREEFHILGPNLASTYIFQHKSSMKAVYKEAGVPCSPHHLCETWDGVRDFAAKTGFPLCLKPDMGVGAQETYRINHFAELEKNLQGKPAGKFILEPYLIGQMESFDGLCDQGGNIVFFTSHVYNMPVREVLELGCDFHFYSRRQMPEDLVQAGFDTIKSFGVRQKFFHLEFFRTEKGLIALEANIRPPGGFMLDMMNYAGDIDLFRGYASVLTHNQFSEEVTWPWHCGYISRSRKSRYKIPQEELSQVLGQHLISVRENPPVIARGMGDFAVLVRTKDLDTLQNLVSLVQAKT